MSCFKFLVCAASLGAALPSLAATATPDKIETRRIIHAYADCVVKGDHDLASRAILSNFTNEDIFKRHRNLIRPDCVAEAANRGVSIGFRDDTYRYAIADALIASDLRTFNTADFSDRAKLTHHQPMDEAELAEARSKKLSEKEIERLQHVYQSRLTVSVLSHYGECIVRGDPMGSRALLMSEPTSVSEKQAIEALRPALVRCLAKGESVKLDKTNLRGTIAINYYRLAMAPKIASQSEVTN